MHEIDIALSLITCLSLGEKLRLKNLLDSLDSLSVLSIEDISQMVGRTVTPDFWDAAALCHDARVAQNLMQKLGIQSVLYQEAQYPALLRETLNAPYALYYRGSLSALYRKCISIVGTRSVCEQGARAAFELAKNACSDGCTVVSGLAYGIDSFAHKGALSVKDGATVAVLPCGIDQVVPYANRMLARHIIDTGGALVSEYAPGLPGEKWRFVQRNRIIAALSPVTVVVQAPAGSGALITADFALEFNRDVVLHEACFCEEAKKAGGNRSGKKIKADRNAALLAESGAAVIKDYAGLVQVLRNAPGVNRNEVEYG
ncbi:MAG: DNA-processing protein DprA [Treponema sp.]|nr:DNA-processing protein DprA [Treponema sp.]